MGPYRFIPVVVLLGAAAALLTDYSKLPIAVRGLNKIMGKPSGGAVHKVAAWRRWLAFVLLVLAFVIAIAG